MTLQNLANNLSLILTTVQDNSKALANFSASMRRLEDRISKLESAAQYSNREVSELKPEVTKIETDNDNLKLQLSVVVDEAVNLRSQLANMRQALINVESKETEKNFLAWNVVSADINEAKTHFQRIVTQGLGMDVPEFTVIDSSSMKKYVKVQ